MASTSVANQVQSLLREPRRDKSEANALSFLDAQFSSLERLENSADLHAAVEQAEHEDDELTTKLSSRALG